MCVCVCVCCVCVVCVLCASRWFGPLPAPPHSEVPEHCVKLERWQGPPQTDKVNSVNCCSLRSLCSDLSLLINISLIKSTDCSFNGFSEPVIRFSSLTINYLVRCYDVYLTASSLKNISTCSTVLISHINSQIFVKAHQVDSVCSEQRTDFIFRGE